MEQFFEILENYYDLAELEKSLKETYLELFFKTLKCKNDKYMDMGTRIMQTGMVTTYIGPKSGKDNFTEGTFGYLHRPEILRDNCFQRPLDKILFPYYQGIWEYFNQNYKDSELGLSMSIPERLFHATNMHWELSEMVKYCTVLTGYCPPVRLYATEKCDDGKYEKKVPYTVPIWLGSDGTKIQIEDAFKIIADKFPKDAFEKAISKFFGQAREKMWKDRVAILNSLIPNTLEIVLNNDVEKIKELKELTESRLKECVERLKKIETSIDKLSSYKDKYSKIIKDDLEKFEYVMHYLEYYAGVSRWANITASAKTISEDCEKITNKVISNLCEQLSFEDVLDIVDELPTEDCSENLNKSYCVRVEGYPFNDNVWDYLYGYGYVDFKNVEPLKETLKEEIIKLSDKLSQAVRNRDIETIGQLIGEEKHCDLIAEKDYDLEEHYDINETFVPFYNALYALKKGISCAYHKAVDKAYEAWKDEFRRWIRRWGDEIVDEKEIEDTANELREAEDWYGEDELNDKLQKIYDNLFDAINNAYDAGTYFRPESGDLVKSFDLLQDMENYKNDVVKNETVRQQIMAKIETLTEEQSKLQCHKDRLTDLSESYNLIIPKIERKNKKNKVLN